MSPQYAPASEALKVFFPRAIPVAVTPSHMDQRTPSIMTTSAAGASSALPSLTQGLCPMAGTGMRIWPQTL